MSSCLQIALNILEIAELSHQISVKLHPNNNETVRSTEVNSIYFFSVLNIATLLSALVAAQLRPALLVWEPWRELLWGFFGG